MLQITDLKLGQKVLAVHKDYAEKGKPGGRVIGLKVSGFKNSAGNIVALLESGNKKHELSTENYHIYSDVQAAISAISSF
jgi:hypothetical protein